MLHFVQFVSSNKDLTVAVTHLILFSKQFPWKKLGHLAYEITFSNVIRSSPGLVRDHLM